MAFVVFISPFCFAQTGLISPILNEHQFREGDFIFQDLDCDICDAIEIVTRKVSSPYSFSHVALVVKINEQFVALEAIGDKVQITSIKQFVNRSKNEQGQNKIVHARLKKNFLPLTEKAIAFAKMQIGKPYDDAFTYGQETYYCSELIYDAYQYAQNGKPFFELSPMTFKNPATNTYFDAWKKYYEKLGMPIPEGAPGCNPNGIFEEEKFDVIQAYY